MGAVVDQGRMLVIDTSCYSVFAQRFIDHVTSHEDVDGPTAVFVTHRHVDHFAGADALPAPIIAHRLTRAGMAAYSQEWLDEMLRSWEASGMILPGLIANPRVVLPEITFSDELVMHVGEIEVRMKHVGGHTADLSVAFLPRQGILFGTDNVFNGKAPYVGEGDFTTWIASLAGDGRVADRDRRARPRRDRWRRAPARADRGAPADARRMAERGVDGWAVWTTRSR